MAWILSKLALEYLYKLSNMWKNMYKIHLALNVLEFSYVWMQKAQIRKPKAQRSAILCSRSYKYNPLQEINVPYVYIYISSIKQYSDVLRTLSISLTNYYIFQHEVYGNNFEGVLFKYKWNFRAWIEHITLLDVLGVIQNSIISRMHFVYFIF